MKKRIMIIAGLILGGIGGFYLYKKLVKRRGFFHSPFFDLLFRVAKRIK